MTESAFSDRGQSLPGPRRIGAYQLIGSLGKGGMGTVYKATDEETSETVALKVLHSELLLHPAALERFRREIAILRSARHEHIVAIRDYGEDEGRPFFVMDHVAGAPLSAVIPRLRDVPWGQQRVLDILAACQVAEPHSAPHGSTTVIEPADDYWTALARIALTLARALDYLHGKGVFHRDLKPSNVILRPDGSPVLMDMGLARASSDETLTQSDQVVGTWRYLAPEQIGSAHAPADEQTDVYQLGATLYELLYLEPIFSGYGQFELRDAKQRADPVPPRREPEPPSPLRAIILRSLALDRRQRYATALDLATDLDHFIRGRPVQRAEPTATAPAPALPRRLRLSCTLYAAAAVAVAIGAVAFVSGLAFPPWRLLARPPGSRRPPAAPPTEEPAGELVVKVDGVPITTRDVARARRLFPLTGDRRVSAEEAVEALVAQTLWRPYFEREKLSATEEEVQAALERFEAENCPTEDLHGFLASRRLTEADLAAHLGHKLARSRLNQKILREMRPEEVEAEYKTHRDWYDGSRVLLREIRVDTQNAGDDAHKLAQAKEHADWLVAQLSAGKDFNTLIYAAPFRDGLIMGDLGSHFRKEEDVDPVLLDAAWPLKVGEYTKPVQTGSGWHILMVVARVPGESTFEDCKSMVQTILMKERANALLSELKAKAKIERPPPKRSGVP